MNRGDCICDGETIAYLANASTMHIGIDLNNW